MPIASALVGSERTTAFPSNTISPSVGCRFPEIMFMSVVLPAPFSPTIACTRPGWISSEMSLLATLAPNDFVTWRSSRRALSMRADFLVRRGKYGNSLGGDIQPPPRDDRPEGAGVYSAPAADGTLIFPSMTCCLSSSIFWTTESGTRLPLLSKSSPTPSFARPYEVV